MRDNTDGRNATDAEFLNLHEFVKAARLKLNQFIWDYLVGGTETETTLRRNRLALDSIAFRPRVLVDVANVDCSHSFLGRKIRLPVALAPVGSLESFDAGGGATVAQAAGAYGVPVFVSSVTQPSLEKVAAAGTGPKVFQLYVRGDDAFIDDHARRAADAGYDAFCITVDTAHYSRRERDLAKRFRKPWRANNTGMEYQAGLNWGHVERFKAKHKLPLIIKGIATAEDAERACSLGVDVVYVSNHGGRQLDHGRGAVDVLPEVIAAVAGRAKVYVDGGFSRGSDVLKGIALGADLVVLGRLYLYGLAAEGAPGIVRLLEILEDEIEECLGLVGATSFAQLDRSFVHPAPPVVSPHVHSAFPLLTLNEGY
ncbi:alpha-hydroxy acid oxidase [Limobrevibacterium gyesilva]|uniref:Alpha-hydroxy-acid oxidizing protein n=1 Tax=Limobrevibacterium gyesilva TaxID=2991712 RepID=A0AA41YUL3_9PROT|nr:alpha-hydroxy acid oxidase [Limobrevibacterium gyesilva]MCW3476785.1 alpha-hydroxy-acid oxidizing protein [Limobrevibacterium gyesilva]